MQTITNLAFDSLFIAKIFLELFMKMNIIHRKLLWLEFVELLMVHFHPQWFLWIRRVECFKL